MNKYQTTVSKMVSETSWKVTNRIGSEIYEGAMVDFHECVRQSLDKNEPISIVVTDTDTKKKIASFKRS